MSTNVVTAPVMVLNSGWTAVHIKPVIDAIGDVFSGVAEILEHSNGDIWHDDNLVSTKYMRHDWASWAKISEPSIAFLKDKAEKLRQSAALAQNPTEARALLDEAEDVEPRVFRGTRGLLRAPDVIRLLDYNDVPDMEIRLTRKNLLLRDSFSCQYCGKRVTSSTFTVDHVIPKSKGGEGSWSNFVISCFKCNIAKRDRTPKEAGMKLLSVPGKPKWYPLTARFSMKIPKSWSRFLPEGVLENRPMLQDVHVDNLSRRKKK